MKRTEVYNKFFLLLLAVFFPFMLSHSVWWRTPIRYPTEIQATKKGTITQARRGVRSLEKNIRSRAIDTAERWLLEFSFINIIVTYFVSEVIVYVYA